MKTILVFASVLFTAGIAQACVGFSGAYSTFRPVAGKYHVLVLDQNDCKTVAVGSFQLDQQTSVVLDEIEPKIFYTDKDNTKKCELTSCRVFTTTRTGLEFAENASIYINGTTCKYDRVAWERVDTWNLKITYRIVDSSSTCRQLGRNASVVMKDIKHALY
ncbi:hypothetical protein ACLVWU_14245 [Bdellovibrio sp. HCB290]|uniref:hypothetical protein n=1 Tax=Bdellovibrio sp. HCB290 TaxID=3394356 RepID=UPI0039B50942